MGKSRLEAFSDGVLAIIITIMVLELKVPHGENVSALIPLFPVLMSYILSFIYVGIYWNNHHHMLHLIQHVSGGVLWANLHLLFWLSLIPFVTGWRSPFGLNFDRLLSSRTIFLGEYPALKPEITANEPAFIRSYLRFEAGVGLK